MSNENKPQLDASSGGSLNGAPGPKSRVMSGMRSTARLHIGNYYGVLRNWLDLQERHQCFFGVMDWHAMTSSYKAAGELRGWVRDILADWLAWGLDPERCVIFVQSEVPEHLELYMYFSMLTPLGWLERVPTWKDAEEDAKATDTHNLGRFAYPVLQTADIAIYRGTHVPIGQDQLAHLEISREIIRRFNFLYNAALPEPRPLFTETPLLPGTDGRKMSKSYGNVFNLTQELEELQTNVRAMVTDPQRVRRNDPGNPAVCSVFAFHKLYSTQEDLDWAASGCVTAAIGCGDCKKKLVANVNERMEKPRLAKKELLQRPEALDSIIANGCQRARAEAKETLSYIKDMTRF